MRHRDDPAARVAVGRTEGADLIEIPIGRVDPRLGAERAARGVGEGLLGAHQHARQRPLPGERRVVALHQQHLPGLLDPLGGADGEEDHIDRDDGVRFELEACNLGDHFNSERFKSR